MSVTFSALNTSITRTFQGREYPTFVELEGEWDMFNLCNANARALLSFLALPFDVDGLCGGCTLPEARSAVLRARATFQRRAGQFTRESEQAMAAVDNADGTIAIRPRFMSMGIDESYLERRLDQFAEFIEVAAQAGADELSWG